MTNHLYILDVEFTLKKRSGLWVLQACRHRDDDARFPFKICDWVNKPSKSEVRSIVSICHRAFAFVEQQMRDTVSYEYITKIVNNNGTTSRITGD